MERTRANLRGSAALDAAHAPRVDTIGRSKDPSSLPLWAEPTMISQPSQAPRLLIFVVAYHAEKTLVSVLERIPTCVFQDYRSEILVVDDASMDNTFGVATAWKAAHLD